MSSSAASPRGGHGGRARGLALLGPGLLTAATGVGAGDLATAGFAGSRLGLAVLWAVGLGAALKFVLTEGLARWQLATGETLLEGALSRLGPVAAWVFLAYLAPWSFFVGAALVAACGATSAALLPSALVPEDPAVAKLLWGGLHSAAGVTLALLGGFRLFERVMAACVGVMFVAVIACAAAIGPDPQEVAAGLLVPRIPDAEAGGLAWTVALMGGVGGTLTVICYGYWIREEGRQDPSRLRECRVDLAVGYAMTALFGMAMIVIAAPLALDGSGVGLVVAVAGRLETELGGWARWTFLAGAWAAVASSLLGVWQAVPIVFADWWRLVRDPEARGPVSRRGVPYVTWLLAIGTIPLLHVARPFREVQRAYAVFGAAFIPVLALALLLLNRRPEWIGRDLRNGRVATTVLVATLLLSTLAAGFDVAGRLGWR